MVHQTVKLQSEETLHLFQYTNKNTLVPEKESQQAARAMNEQRSKTKYIPDYSGWAFPIRKIVKVTEFKESSDDAKKK